MVRNDKGLVALGTKELINETKRLKAAQKGQGVIIKGDQNVQDIEEIKTE